MTRIDEQTSLAWQNRSTCAQSCCPCPQGVFEDKFKVLVLVLGAQVLVLVLVLDT